MPSIILDNRNVKCFEYLAVSLFCMVIEFCLWQLHILYLLYLVDELLLQFYTFGTNYGNVTLCVGGTWKNKESAVQGHNTTQWSVCIQWNKRSHMMNSNLQSCLVQIIINGREWEETVVTSTWVMIKKALGLWCLMERKKGTVGRWNCSEG